MENIKYVIIPDIHCRDFWKDTFEKYKNVPDVRFIFLGDYVDPYERYTNNEIVNGLLEVIEIKRSMPDKVILLLGNHDMHYVSVFMVRSSRYNWEIADALTSTYNSNLSLFDMTYYDEINGRKFLFSHAGISKGWLNKHYRGELPDFNGMLRTPEKLKKLSETLSDISYHRWGDADYGSMVWADINEFDGDNILSDVIQIVGHTQQPKKYVNKLNSVFCLDTRSCYFIDNDGHLYDSDETLIF